MYTEPSVSQQGLDAIMSVVKPETKFMVKLDSTSNTYFRAYATVDKDATELRYRFPGKSRLAAHVSAAFSCFRYVQTAMVLDALQPARRPGTQNNIECCQSAARMCGPGAKQPSIGTILGEAVRGPRKLC